MTILSRFNYRHVIPNLQEFLCILCNTKEDVLKNGLILVHILFCVPPHKSTALAQQSLDATLIKHLIQQIKSSRLTWKLDGLCVGAVLEQNSAGLWPSRN